MKRLLLTLLTLAGLAPALLRWIAEGRISVEMGAVLAVLVTALIAFDGLSFRVVLALVAVVGFGLHYAADGSWETFLSFVLLLLPLIVCLLGFYIIFRGAIAGAGSKKGRRLL